MSTPTNPAIWTDPGAGKPYHAATLEPIRTAGADLGEKRRMVDGPPLGDDDLEEFARQLAGRAKLGKRTTTTDPDPR